MGKALNKSALETGHLWLLGSPLPLSLLFSPPQLCTSHIEVSITGGGEWEVLRGCTRPQLREEWGRGAFSGMGPPLGVDKIWEKLTRWELDMVVARGPWAFGMTSRMPLPGQCRLSLLLPLLSSWALRTAVNPWSLNRRASWTPGRHGEAFLQDPFYLRGHRVYASSSLRLALHVTLRQRTSSVSVSSCEKWA